MRILRAATTSGPSATDHRPAGASPSASTGTTGARAWLVREWPLVALLVLAAVVRFATIGEQSLWYDEAYTPVHVLHPSLFATLRTMVHTENTPPLWYVLIWAWSRVLGTGAVALRSLSAIAGLATVAVGWGIGRELGTRRTAIVLTAILAVDPLFVWYSQEARAYALFALFAALSLWCFLRARRAPTAAALAAWSAASVLALLSHYFAAFLVGPEALILCYDAARRPRGERRPSPALVAAVGAIVVCGLALVPLIAAQGGHGTQWIGRWALSSRLVAIPGYFLLGGQSATFGHGLLLLTAVPALIAIGLLPGLTRGEWRAAGLMAGLGAVSILLPLLLVAAGHDYLAPRNVIASWLPLAAALAVVLAGERAGTVGIVLTVLVCLAGLGIDIAIDAVPKFQRADWSGVAQALHGAAPDRAVVVVELGSAPLEYYAPPLQYVHPGATVRVSEIDLVGYAPLNPGAATPLTPAFKPAGRLSIHRLDVYRFVAASPQTLTERELRRDRLTPTSSEVLAPPSAVSGGSGGGAAVP